ncbi:MAG TPA: InlB B-repeat-containing protein [Acholeplasmataceae bacterium]|nr:InlB B-repeat-containing protein [Acholeplasmataceae bacterium]
MKRVIIVVITLAFLSWLVGCVRKSTWKEILKEVEIRYQDGDAENDVKSDLIILKRISCQPKAKVFWRSSNEDVISNEGEVKRAYLDTSVTITARIVFKKEERFKEFQLLVTGLDKVKITLIFANKEIVLKPNELGFLTLPNLARKDALFVGFRVLDSNLFVDLTKKVKNDLKVEVVYNIYHYQVCFNSNGGSDVKPIDNIEHSMTINKLPIPSRDGYLFLGWIYFNKEGGESLLIEKVTPINDNLSCYAVWEKMKGHIDE